MRNIPWVSLSDQSEHAYHLGEFAQHFLSLSACDLEILVRRERAMHVPHDHLLRGGGLADGKHTITVKHSARKAIHER